MAKKNNDYLNPKWQRKRLEILERDNFKCTECDDKESTLHVHHTYYDNHFEYWDYTNDSYITLCDKCHKQTHKMIKELNPMKIFRLSNLLYRFHDFSCSHKYFMYDYDFYQDLIFQYINSGESNLFYELDENESETDFHINNFNIIQSLLFYKIRKRNVKKYVEICMNWGNGTVSPSEIGKELLNISRNLKRSVF